MDPRFVKFYAYVAETHLDGSKGMQKKIVQRFGAHKCTRDEWAQLYPGKNEIDQGRIELIKESHSLLCFNSEDEEGKPVDLSLFGADYNGYHRHIEFGFLPCTHEQEDPAKKSETARLIKTP
jgi:hypothetical protein